MKYKNENKVIKAMKKNLWKLMNKAGSLSLKEDI